MLQTINGDVHVSFDVTNTGKVHGEEVVQLYLKDKISSVTVYETQLRGFERITLDPGQKKTINFILKPTDLALLDRNMKLVVEPGEFEVFIGSSSTDIRLKKIFTIQ